MWRSFRERGYDITSRWIDSGAQESDMESIWVKCHTDIAKADVLVFFMDDGDVAKGALVEVGMALARGMTVLAVGATPDHSWTNHPGVVVCPSLEDAMSTARKCWTSGDKDGGP